MMDAKKRKIFLCAAVLVAIVSLLTGWYFTLRKGVYCGDNFYYKVAEATYRHSDADYVTFTDDHNFRLLSEGMELTGSIQAENQNVEITFSDGTGISGEWNGIFLDDGEAHDLIRIEVGGQSGSKTDDTAYACASVLCSIYFGKEERISRWFVPVLGILIYILGIVDLFYPQEVHFFFSRWMYHNPELSDEGIFVERISGIVICVMGVCVMSGVLFFLIT